MQTKSQELIRKVISSLEKAESDGDLASVLKKITDQGAGVLTSVLRDGTGLLVEMQRGYLMYQNVRDGGFDNETAANMVRAETGSTLSTSTLVTSMENYELRLRFPWLYQTALNGNPSAKVVRQQRPWTVSMFRSIAKALARKEDGKPAIKRRKRKK